MIREALTAEKLAALEPGEAAALFVARRAEGFTESEQQLFHDWLEIEANRRQFESADRAWQSFDDSEGDEIVAAMRAHALAPRPRGRARWWPAAAAASMLLVIGLTWYLMPSVTAFEHATAKSEVREIQLPDGSKVTLDGDSRLNGRFNDQGRHIELRRGRALFAVAPDGSRPFTVTASGHRVIAVGTRFDVDLLTDGLTVTLLEGRVNVESVDSSTTPIALVAGQRFVERGGIVEIRTLDEAAEAGASWREGFIRFDDQPLSEAVAIMNRYSHERIVISDPRVGALRVSGQFRAGESQRFASTLAEVHGLRVLRRDNSIELIRD